MMLRGDNCIRVLASRLCSFLSHLTRHFLATGKEMAEGAGFEPARELLTPYAISSRAP